MIFIPGLLLIAASLVPFSNAGYWWVRIFDFPRLQLLFLNLLCLGAILIFYPLDGTYLALALALLAAMFIDLYRIFPYTLLAKPESAKLSSSSDSIIKIVSANVYIKNRQAGAFHRVIRESDPHVFLMLEADDWWEEQCRELETDYPHSIKIPQDNTYGMLLFSKLPLENPEVRFLIDEEVPSCFAAIHLNQDTTLKFIGLHPRPPRPKEGASDERDSELMRVAHHVRENEGDAIVAIGDLNDVAWSHTTRLFRRVSGMLDPRVGRGFYSTFPVRWPPFRIPLDHVFHTQAAGLVDLRRLGNIGSDHFPIEVTFAVKKKALRRQDRNEATKSEMGESREFKKRGREWEGPKEKVRKEEA